MKALPIYVLIVAFALISCSKTKEKDDYLSVTQCKDYKLNNQVVNVCFNRLINDSRCPKDVYCVWEGYAIVELNVLINTELHKIQLRLSDTTINNVKIEVQDLTPYPCVNCSTHPNTNDYKVKLKLTEV